MGNYLVDEAIKQVIDFNADISRSALSALYPNDFEYYMVSLELVGTDSKGKDYLIRYFTFPVNPTSIQQTNPKITNIKKTFGGVSIVSSSDFIPIDINIQGNFGRGLKVVLNNASKSDETYNSIALIGRGSDSSSIWYNQNKVGSLLSKPATIQSNEFSPFVKTGYGSLKLLEAICRASDESDNGIPRKLFFHNPANGHSYLVKVNSFNMLQNQSQNMIWSYTLSLKAVCDTQNIRGVSDKSLQSALMQGVVQKGVNKAVSKTNKTVSAAQDNSIGLLKTTTKASVKTGNLVSKNVF